MAKTGYQWGSRLLLAVLLSSGVLAVGGGTAAAQQEQRGPALFVSYPNDPKVVTPAPDGLTLPRGGDGTGIPLTISTTSQTGAGMAEPSGSGAAYTDAYGVQMQCLTFGTGCYR
jgi:hypothetical protein